MDRRTPRRHSRPVLPAARGRHLAGASPRFPPWGIVQDLLFPQVSRGGALRRVHDAVRRQSRIAGGTRPQSTAAVTSPVFDTTPFPARKVHVYLEEQRLSDSARYGTAIGEALPARNRAPARSERARRGGGASRPLAGLIEAGSPKPPDGEGSDEPPELDPDRITPRPGRAGMRRAACSRSSRRSTIPAPIDY